MPHPRLRNRAWAIGLALLTTLAILLVGILFDQLARDRTEQRLRAQSADRLNELRSALSTQLHRVLQQSAQLAAYLAAQTAPTSPAWLPLAPLGGVRHGLIRHIALYHPHQAPVHYPVTPTSDALRQQLAIPRRPPPWLAQPWLQGPYALPEGLLLFIYQPLARGRAVTPQRQAHGHLAFALDLPRLYQAAGLPTQDEDYQIAIRAGEHPDSPVFFGAPQVFQQTPVIRPLKVLNSHWQLAAHPRHGWRQAPLELWVWRSAGLLLAIGVGLLVGRLVCQQARVRANRAYLLALTHSLPDTVFVLDPQGRYLEVFGGAKQDRHDGGGNLQGLRMHDVMPSAQADFFLSCIQRCLDNNQLLTIEYQLAPADTGDLPDTGPAGPQWFEGRVTPLLVSQGRAVMWIAINITRRKHVEAALQASRDQYRTLAERVQALILRTDTQLQIRYLNNAWTRLAAVDAAALMGRAWLPLIHPRDRTAVAQRLQPLLAGRQEHCCIELRLTTLSTRWFELHASPEYDSQGLLTGLLGILIDISERKQAESRRRLAAAIIDHTSEAVIVTDRQLRIVQVNRAFSQITGYSASEVLGDKPNLLRAGEHERAFFQRLWRTLNEQGVWRGEICDRHRDGHRIYTLHTITAIRNDERQVTHYVSLFSDITERKAAEYRLAHLATHDALTRLPNRTYLFEQLQGALARAAEQQHSLALLFMDLDGFKPINDKLGHETGDQVLRIIAERMQRLVRHQDTLARLGGDEFVLLLVGVTSEEAERIAAKLIQAIHAPIQLETRQLQVGVSIGISLYPQHGMDASTLLKQADTAMYQAKASGRLQYRFADADDQDGLTA